MTTYTNQVLITDIDDEEGVILYSTNKSRPIAREQFKRFSVLAMSLADALEGGTQLVVCWNDDDVEATIYVIPARDVATFWKRDSYEFRSFTVPLTPAVVEDQCPRCGLLDGHRYPCTAVLTPDEQAIVTYLEKDRGRPLTEQEIHLSLEQARHIGEL